MGRAINFERLLRIKKEIAGSQPNQATRNFSDFIGNWLILNVLIPLCWRAVLTRAHLETLKPKTITNKS